jgi:hypothetical protein
MAYNVLSSSIDRGYLAIMLRTDSYQEYHHSYDCQKRIYFEKDTVVTNDLGWLAEFCGHSFPSRAILVVNGPSLDRVDSLVLWPSICALLINIRAKED